MPKWLDFALDSPLYVHIIIYSRGFLEELNYKEDEVIMKKLVGLVILLCFVPAIKDQGVNLKVGIGSATLNTIV